jgi:hypothetical protein
MKRKSLSTNDAEEDSAKPQSKPSKVCSWKHFHAKALQHPIQKTKLKEEEAERDELDSEPEAPLRTVKKPSKYKVKAEVQQTRQSTRPLSLKFRLLRTRVPNARLKCHQKATSLSS